MKEWSSASYKVRTSSEQSQPKISVESKKTQAQSKIVGSDRKKLLASFQSFHCDFTISLLLHFRCKLLKIIHEWAILDNTSRKRGFRVSGFLRVFKTPSTCIAFCEKRMFYNKDFNVVHKVVFVSSIFISDDVNNNFCFYCRDKENKKNWTEQYTLCTPKNQYNPVS